MSRLCLCLRLRGWCEPSLRALNGKKPLSKAHMNMHTCASMEEGGWLGRGRFRSCGPVARIFCGGVRTSRIGTQYFNVWMIRYASSENTQGRVTNLRSNWNRDEFSCYRKHLRAPKAQASRGVWGHAPQKFFFFFFSSLKALKCHFQRSQTENCVKKVPKIDRCHKIWHIFIIKNYYHTSFNARKIRY